jgi:thioredoxin reductase
VIFAIGQRPESDCLKQVKRWRGGRVEVNSDMLTTNVPAIFAGGDAAGVSVSIVEAISSGHRAARSIATYLQGLKTAGSQMTEKAGEGLPVGENHPDGVARQVAN